MTLSSRKIYAAASALSAAALALAVSTHYDVENAYNELRAAHQTTPEFIETQGLLPADAWETVRPSTPIGPRHLQLHTRPAVRTYWTYVETSDWILLNGPRGTHLCPHVLAEFGAVNAPYEAMSLDQVRLLSSGFEGTALTLKVLVPRFRVEPRGLTNCPGFAYDSISGRLRVGKKFVAYLWREQPKLTR